MARLPAGWGTVAAVSNEAQNLHVIAVQYHMHVHAWTPACAKVPTKAPDSKKRISLRPFWTDTLQVAKNPFATPC